jgi:hypothetical protein
MPTLRIDSRQLGLLSTINSVALDGTPPPQQIFGFAHASIGLAHAQAGGGAGAGTSAGTGSGAGSGSSGQRRRLQWPGRPQDYSSRKKPRSNRSLTFRLRAGQIKVAVEFISAASFFCCLRFARTDTSKHVLQPLRRWQVRQTASFDPRLNHGFNETVGSCAPRVRPDVGPSTVGKMECR